MEFNITSKRGVNYGIFEADSKREAFILLLRAGGYRKEEVWLDEGGELCYLDSSYKLMCGTEDDYEFEIEE